MDKPKTNVMERTTALDLLVDSSAFWKRLQADIAAATKRVYIQTLSFEGDRAGRLLADGVSASAAPDKRIIVDNYTKYVISDKFRYSPRNWFDRELKAEHRATMQMMTDLRSEGTRVKFVNPVGPFFLRMPARNHKKIIVIDDDIGYIGGINFSDHNFSWHDMMLRIENREIVDFLAGDFLSSWEGKRFSGRFRAGELELFSFDGWSNRAAFDPILNLIRSAESSIYVQSPYLSSPFTDAMRHAADRGVTVTVVTPDDNNKGPMRDYIHWEAARSGFDLHLYQNGMTHLKAMLIDDAYLIVGSCNFDYFSYCFEEETMAVISDRELIAEFKDRIVDRDYKACQEANLNGAHLRGSICNFQISSLARLLRLFNRSQ
jgi:cardiolipin synthase